MDSTINHKRVTVLMSVFNGEQYLKEAIDSVLNQTYTDFDLLIINDGSTDNSLAIIQSYKDPRIKLINNDQNLGLINSLNKGIGLIHSDYIIRMDSDDICLSNRIEVQVNFMDTHPEVGVSGSHYFQLKESKHFEIDLPLSSEEIKAFLIFNCPLAHPTTIIRKQVLDTYHIKYETGYLYSEDYHFWLQLSKVSQLRNLKESLIYYRMHPNQITGNPAKAQERLNTVTKIRSISLEELSIQFTPNEMHIHNLIADGLSPANELEFQQAEPWLQKLSNAYYKRHSNASHFNAIVYERWLRVCVNYLGSVKGISYFYKSQLRKSLKIELQIRLHLYKVLYKSWKRK
jgi:glycosyltransferase involved in cell wall biosynthesis